MEWHFLWYAFVRFPVGTLSDKWMAVELLKNFGKIPKLFCFSLRNFKNAWLQLIFQRQDFQALFNYFEYTAFDHFLGPIFVQKNTNSEFVLQKMKYSSLLGNFHFSDKSWLKKSEHNIRILGTAENSLFLLPRL